MEMDGSFLGMVGKNGGGQEGGERGGGSGGGFEDGDGISLSSEKLARTDASPFKMSAFSRCENGPTFYYGSASGGRLDSVYDVPSGPVAASSAASTRTLQPFPVPLKSPGMTSLRFPFTPAQWLELEQQALIFKHMVNAVPVPPDLLRPIRSFADATSDSLAWGTGGVSLRSANGVDPQPGRCRRTDGKKWRCSRDVASDQKYCEHHMHRGRPRSRKPVEVQLQRNSSINVLPSSTAHASTALPRSLPLPSPLSSSSTSCPTSSLSPLTSPSSDLPPKHFQSSGLKVPTQTTMAAGLGNRSSRYLNWMGGASPHQWELVQSDTQEHQQLRLSINGDNTHILNYHDNLSLLPHSGCRSNGVQADNRNSLFGCNDLQGVQSTTECQPRQFIDAWSTEDRWFPTITATATATPSNPSTVATTTSKSSASKLPLSPLSLSMSGGVASAGDEIDPIRMGPGVSDSDGGEAPKPRQGPIWMLPASWQSSSPLGGPLAEVLQSSSSTPMAPNFPKVSDGKSSPAGLNLRTDGWGDASPGGSPGLDSSPTGVLQKTLAAFSDSSSSSSPTFGAKSEFSLQWLSQQMPKLPSS